MGFQKRIYRREIKWRKFKIVEKEIKGTNDDATEKGKLNRIFFKSLFVQL